MSSCALWPSNGRVFYGSAGSLKRSTAKRFTSRLWKNATARISPNQKWLHERFIYFSLARHTSGVGSVCECASQNGAGNKRASAEDGCVRMRPRVSRFGSQGFSWNDDTKASICSMTSRGLLMKKFNGQPQEDENKKSKRSLNSLSLRIRQFSWPTPTHISFVFPRRH